MKSTIPLVLAVALAAAGCEKKPAETGNQPGPEEAEQGPAATQDEPSPPEDPSSMPKNMAFSLSSDAIEDGGTIPTKFTCDGEGVSPPLKWAQAPEGTKSFAVVVTDPDAPKGTFHHWGIWAIPGNERALTANVPDEAKVAITTPSTTEGDVSAFQAKNDFGKVGYGAPCPPPGDEAHRYIFRIFALDNPGTTFPEVPTVEALTKELEADAVDQASFKATYRRQAK